MQSKSMVQIIEPASSFALISLEELKACLKITSTTEDALLTALINQSSDAVSRYCNRVFAKEKVTETFRQTSYDCLFLARWPIKEAEFEAVTADGSEVDADEYELDGIGGRLTNLTGTPWAEPIQVTYKGGYLLPDEAPPSLRQAVTLLGRENYNAVQRGDSTVRMIGHKESRVIYFDPNAANRGAAVSQGGSAAQRAIHDLLTHFTRFEA